MRSKKRQRRTDAWLRSKEGKDYLRGLQERPLEEARELKRMLAEKRAQAVEQLLTDEDYEVMEDERDEPT